MHSNGDRLSDQELTRAKSIWQDYQQQHDVASWNGRTAGIDPRSGRVWLAESGVEIARQL